MRYTLWCKSYKNKNYWREGQRCGYWNFRWWIVFIYFRMNIWNIIIWVIKSWVDWKYFIINWNVKRNSISATCFTWWIWLTSSRTQAQKLLASTILWLPRCVARLFKSEKGTFGVDLYITGSPRENTFKVMVNMNEVTTRLLNFPWLRNFFTAQKSLSFKAKGVMKKCKSVIYQCNKSAWFCQNIKNPQDGNGEN